MKLNKPTEPIFTHEGATAKHISSEMQLRRSVMSCMLWEKEFYESGDDISKRIAQEIPKVDAHAVASIAVEARERMKLRHVPLFIVSQMSPLPTHKFLVSETLARVIQRPDELAEFMAIYWKDGKRPLSAQVKRGLSEAFGKFSAYQFAKYNRDNAIKLRDVAFLCHAKAKDADHGKLMAQLVNKDFYPETTKSSGFKVKESYQLGEFERLATPDTWEVALSGGKDKKEAFERLISEQKLGALALLRNLRNMQEAGVPKETLCKALAETKTQRVLPYRFIAAARYAPNLEPELEQAMFKCLSHHEKLVSKTFLLIDVSGSMDVNLSQKSDLRRLDAACGLAMLTREICEEVEIATFSDRVVDIPLRRGFALRDAITQSQPHRNTYLGRAVTEIVQNRKFDRIIVITDEQSHDKVPDVVQQAFMINVASYRNGVGYGVWNHIDGFSETVIDYIIVLKKLLV